jgi:hypothetical protein
LPGPRFLDFRAMVGLLALDGCDSTHVGFREPSADVEAGLAERLKQVALPELDLKEVAGLMDDFERVFESGLNPEKKHLLHRLVKEVRVQDRDTAEVWYSFPRPAAPDQRTVDSHIWLLR